MTQITKEDAIGLPIGINPIGRAGYRYLCPFCGWDNLETNSDALLKFDFRDNSNVEGVVCWVWWEVIKCQECKKLYKWEFYPV